MLSYTLIAVIRRNAARVVKSKSAYKSSHITLKKTNSLSYRMTLHTLLKYKLDTFHIMTNLVGT